MWTGEFGRLPISQGTDGRDHNRHAFALWLAGGGFKRGCIVGATDNLGEQVTDKFYKIESFGRTLYHLLGIDATKEYRGPDGRPHLLNYHGTPIAQALA